MTLYIILYAIPALIGICMIGKCINHEEYRAQYAHPETFSFKHALTLVFLSLTPIVNDIWFLHQIFQDFYNPKWWR